MGDLLHRCLTKATTSEGDQLRYSPNWVLARRGLLRVETDRLTCGDWEIRYADIEDAVLVSVSSWFIPGFVLKVRAGGKIYQFGLNYGRFWKGDLPFRVSREKGRLGYSTFSLVGRGILVAVVLYWVWKRFLAG